MKKWLNEKLVCPECVPEENPLDLKIREKQDEDVTEGQLGCRVCGRSYPIGEVNRTLREQDSMFLFSDPFSWDESVVNSKLWLSGKTDGKYEGRGIDNICRILSGEDGIFDLP